jgi:hypothetical protein
LDCRDKPGNDEVKSASANSCYSSGMNEIPIPWPQKQRELHHHHFDSTIWNDFECGGALASTSMSVAWPPLLVPGLRLLPLPLRYGWGY